MKGRRGSAGDRPERLRALLANGEQRYKPWGEKRYPTGDSGQGQNGKTPRRLEHHTGFCYETCETYITNS